MINGYFGVKICKIDYYNGMLVCHIVLDNFAKESIDTLKEGLLEYLSANLPVEYQPHIINFMESLPRTPLGKVDYTTLANLTKEIVDNESKDLSTRLKVYNKELSLILKK